MIGIMGDSETAQAEVNLPREPPGVPTGINGSIGSSYRDIELSKAGGAAVLCSLGPVRLFEMRRQAEVQNTIFHLLSSQAWQT